MQRLARDFKLDLRVRAIAGSKTMRLAAGAIDLARWRDEYKAGGDPLDLDRFADHVHADHFPHAVIIDCSASAEVAKHYRALAVGRHPHRHAEQEGQQRGLRATTSASRTRGARPARTTCTKRPSAPACR